MTAHYDQVSEAVAFLRGKGAAPRVLVILGTGLGSFASNFSPRNTVSYDEIPHFPASTSPGHEGELVLGGDALIMAGRFHYYEGYSMQELTLPVRVAHALGAKTMLITSAVGSLNPDYRLGEIVGIKDHLHLMGDGPLRGPHDERLGPRFPDMSAPYDTGLLDRAEELARADGRRLPRAVLSSVAGPQLETRAEYRFLRAAGADVVGMSTTPEAIVAAQCGMRVCALSVVTDICLPDALEPVDIERILKTASDAAPRMEQLLLALLKA